MAYQRTTWRTGDPITEARMNNIEAGIEGLDGLEGRVTAVESKADNADSRSSTNATSISSLQERVASLDTKIDQNTASGNWAAGQIHSATDQPANPLATTYNDLTARFNAIDSANEQQDGLIAAVSASIEAAKRANVPEDTLKKRFESVESTASTLTTGFNSLTQNINNAGGHDGQGNQQTLATRLNAIDGGATPTRTLPNVIEEITEAHGANNVHGTLNNRFGTIENELNAAHSSHVLAVDGADKNYISIDARFEAIEGELVGATNMNSRIDTLEGNVSSLANNKVNKTDIANNLTTTNTGKVLDASQGKILKDTIDNLDTAYKAADTQINTAISNMDAAYKAADSTLTNSITDMDTAYKAADTALSNRIDTLSSNTSGTTNALDTRLSTAEGKITTLESTVNNATTGLAATKAIADAAKAQADAAKAKADTALQPADITTLTNKVNALEDKDTIVVPYDGVHSNYTNEVPNIATADIKTNADYLIADDEGKYFYWRYINNNWELISGAGGGGTGSSSGEFAATLESITSPDENTDYFVGNDTIGYTHYRYIPGENNAVGRFVKILPNNLINGLSVDSYGGLVAHSIGDNQTNLLADFYALKDVTYTPNYDPQDNTKLVSQTLQFTRTDGEQLNPIVIIGGGGESGSVYTVNIETTSPISRSIPANSTDPVTISAKVVMKQGNELLGGGATAVGQVQYRRYGTSTWNMGDQIEVQADNPALKYTIQNNTYFTIDVSKYLETDQTTQIRLAIVASPAGEGTEVERYLTFSISKVNISITAEAFDYASVKSSNFNFNYRCFGPQISKTVHFLLDGEDIVTPVVTSTHNVGLQQTIPLTGKSNGMHTFQVYFITSGGLESNRLNYFILYNTDNTREAPLIGAAAENTSIVDGDELIVNYSVSTVGSEKTDSVVIELYKLENNNEVILSTTTLTDVTNNRLADPPYRTFDYPRLEKASPSDPDPDPITVYVRLTATHNGISDSQTVAVEIRYLETKYTLSPEGALNLVYEYNAYGRSNNNVDKETYVYPYHAVNGSTINFNTTFNNFNWATDGYVDGESLTIGGGATVNINVPIFNSKYNNISIEENENVEKITTNGRTIEIDYEVLSTTNMGATIIDCMTTGTNPKGFRVTPQNCYLLNSGSNIDIDETGFIKNEENVAAAYLNPGMRTHLVFVIEPTATSLAADNTYHQSANIYVNGEFANSCPYNIVGNDFDNNATITIGSDTCLIKIYSIKLYNRGLTAAQVLHNYEVAPVATRNKLQRLEDNDVLDSLGHVDYEKARKKYTCLLLTGMGTVNGIAVPTMAPYKGYPSVVGRTKGGEPVGKTESGLLLTKPSTTEASGYTVEFNLQDKLVDNGLYGYVCSNNVQGTSSQKFPVKNLKVYLAKGKEGTEVYDSDDPETRQVIAYTESSKVKYALRGSAGSGDSTLCWKADYMSTDHANTFNANIANTLYTPEDRLSDRWTDKTQFAVYGIKCLLFQQSGPGATPEFVGDGCLNNDKGNHGTFGLETKQIENVWPGDEDNNTMCQKWDFRNNTNSLLFFKHDGLFEIVDGKPAATSCLECIYPDEGDLNDAQTAYKKEHGGATNPALDVNYNHFQILSSWLGNRANYWYETNSSTRAAKKQIFINEFRNHFNFNHILIYYLFMEYTALCDNRVKNIHMRTDNSGLERVVDINGNVLLDGNLNPNYGPWTLAENLETRTMQEPIMDENGNYQFDQSGNMVLGNVNHVFVKDSVINNIDWQQGEGHSNFAIWAPVLYDLDSCFGAENVGYLKVRYDADWNYSLYNKLQFAGFDSILWLQVEDCFQNELKAMAKTLYNRATGLNYTTFYRQQITDNLASVCPAITNQDMILKYETPWTEGYLDYSQDTANPTTSTDEYKYLQRGTRTAQKATFMKQRSMLLASKYDGNEFKQDKITFRAGTLVNQANAVITLTANQKLYHGVQFGDLNDVSKVTRRAVSMYDADNDTWVPITTGWIPEFVPCRVQNIGDMGNTDGIEIYGASVLNDIGDLSRFHPYQIDVGKAINLKKLIIGSATTGFSNTSTTKIDGLNSCSLLEEINVCNLKNLTSLSLVNNGFIKKVYATGSGLNTLSLPRGGILDTIAYGENTNDITIINQSRLASFTYENSGTNNYANVTRLWIENTPNVPVKDIITARLTSLNSNDEGLRAGGLRVVGIDLNLGSDSAFLQLLVSDLAKGTYLTAQGGHIEGGTDYPTITGTIRITQIRRSLYNKLHEIYPELTVIANRVDEEYEVKYYNYDGTTLLFTDHGTNEDYVKDPAFDIDPITNAPYLATICPPDGIPTKPADAQYKYKFGLYNNQGKYRRFTGWVKSGTSINPTSSDTINGDLTFIAVYPTTEDQYYTVSWYQEASNISDNSAPIDTKSVKYGTDLSSEQSPVETGTMMRVRTGGNSVKVFKGWSCPLGKITHDVDVYGLWEESTINDTTENITMETLTAADIYALARLSGNRKTEVLASKLGSHIMVPMGQQYDYPEGVNITNLLGNDSIIELDGSTDMIRVYDGQGGRSNIRPLSVNSDWTLALDYKFLMDSESSFFNGEYVLASCYQNANSSIVGFKVSLIKNTSSNNHAIQVSWGTNTLTIDYATVDSTSGWTFQSYRNVVVLSHNSDDPNKLRVSYRVPNTSGTAPYGANYSTTLVNTNLSWESNANISTPLIIGGNYRSTTTDIENSSTTRCPAQGVIYWAKYWDTDLGEINCSNIAAWTHETIPFVFTGYNAASLRSTEQIYANSALSFAAAQGIGDRYFYAGTGTNDSSGLFGWHQSNMRAICNNLIYVGFPETYKAIIALQTVEALKRYCGEGTQYNTFEPNTQDYLFLVARREIDDTMTPGSNEESREVNTNWIGPWNWFADTRTVLQLWSTSSNVVEETQVMTDNYYLYRFNNGFISEDSRIFRLENRPTTINNLTLRTSSGNQPITMRSGDIWVNNDGVAYIYRSEEDITHGDMVDIRESNGGWKQATEWALRTYNTSATSPQEWHFMRVTTQGTIITSPTSSSRNTPRLICPEFTVRV